MSRSSDVARWVAPSAIAACAGGLVAGLVDSWRGDGALLGLATPAATGFVVMLVTPVLFVLALLARGAIAGWAPRELAARYAEDGGGMPRLAGWLVTLVLGCIALAWLVFRGTWLLVAWTQFKPKVVSLAQPVIAIVSTLLVLLFAPLAVTLVSRIARAIDRRWRARGHATLLSPRRLFGGAVVLLAAALVAVWLVVVSPRIGPLAIGVLLAPATGIVAAILVHSLRVRALRIALPVLALASAGFAVATAYLRPAAALGIWGDQPLAGLMIEQVFSLQRIRDALPLDDYRPVPRPGAKHRDVIVVMIDTLRADRTPPYGGPAEMPTLKALGERGAVFQWAFSPSNVTRRSVPTMLTGTSPDRVRGRVVGWGLRLDPRHILLAERLRAAGYTTAGFVCCGGLYGDDLRTGFDRGMQTLVIDESAERLGTKAGAWLAARTQAREPAFVWLHILEPHNWGTIGYSGTMPQIYDRTLAAVDKALIPLIAAYADRGPDDQPIIIVTSDHGEGLGDHGQRNHSTNLTNSQIRVPLVISGPTVRAVRPLESVGLVDLVPTVLDLAGFIPPTGRSIDGRSIAPLARGDQLGSLGTAYAAMIADRSNPGGSTAVVEGGWKLVDVRGMRQLFAIHTDPDEKHDVIGKHPDVAKRLGAQLDAVRARAKLPAFD